MECHLNCPPCLDIAINVVIMKRRMPEKHMQSHRILRSLSLWPSLIEVPSLSLVAIPFSSFSLARSPSVCVHVRAYQRRSRAEDAGDAEGSIGARGRGAGGVKAELWTMDWTVDWTMGPWAGLCM